MHVLPDCIEERIPRQDLAGMLDEMDEQIVGARFKRQPVAAALHPPRAEVERDIRNVETRRPGNDRRFAVGHQ